MDYQKTINLPTTDFSMKAGLVQKEPQILARWEKDQIYQRIRTKSAGKPTFILHDGPPYANGNIHIGHALNKILKDIIVKYKTMRGFDALYVPGWDCHGLPIEHQLLKDLKANKGDFDTVAFRKKAHDYAMKYVGLQREEFKRLGVMGQWDNPYLTLAPEYEYWILKSLGKLVDKGYVYRSLKPVNWCYSCETALAEAEVEHEQKESITVYVKFHLINTAALKLPSDKKVSLLVWTTTPWTLLANVAVAAHPDFTYVALDTGAEILIIEKTLSASVLALNNISSATTVRELTGLELAQASYAHPFDKQPSCPIVTAAYVTREDGTGLVHIAPGHGQEDFQVGLKYNLPVVMPVNGKGVYTQEGAPFTGQFVFKANPVIVDHLSAAGLLYFTQKINHSYPHCWRCKNPIIFRATEQWFLNVNHDSLRERLKKAIVDDVQWIPPAGRERILGMVNTRPDWCLSRQRHWGVPIPALSCDGCSGRQYLFVEVIDHLASLVKTHGSGVWFERDVADLLPKGFVCPHCRGSNFKKSTDILDVWFDSGVSHQAVFSGMINKPLPADLYLEGSDQHRGWFQSSLIPSVAMDGRAPYRQVLTHGFVVDGAGRKMSKSQGNVVKPQEMIDQNGADIIRWWVASSSYNDDVRISKEIVERIVESYRKIRNTVRYLLGNLNGFNPDTDRVAYQDLLKIDRWALHQLGLTIKAVECAYDEYDFPKVYKLIHAFCNEELSMLYLDILKDRLYTCPAHLKERKSAQTVLYYILDSLTRILAPMMVFTSEEIFALSPKPKALNGQLSVHELPWPQVSGEWVSQALQDEFRRLFDLRADVLKALDESRKAGHIGSGLQAKVHITLSGKDFQEINAHRDLLEAVMIVSQVALEEKDKGSWDIRISQAEGKKCARCWNYRTDVGTHADHPEICGRCVQQVTIV